MLDYNPIPYTKFVSDGPIELYLPSELAHTSYRPTVVISAGGAGYKILRRLQRWVHSHFAPDQRDIFQFLAFDTTAEEVPEGEEPLAPGDFVYFPAFDAADLIRHLDENPHIAAWWPGGTERPYRPAFAGTGARRVRAVGRLVLYNYISDLILPRIEEKINRAIEINAQHGRGATSIKIYVIASTAGGTGSAMAIDIAYNARLLALRKQPTAFVTGVLVTDEAFQPRASTTNTSTHFSANSYALLSEINHFSRTRTFHVRYNDVHTTEDLPEGAFRPFDVCYLLGLTNAQGQALDSLDSLCDMAAHEMFLEIASPMQDTASNRLDNVHANDWTIGGQPTAFSSFALSSLVYPIAGIASWSALRTHEAFSREVLLTPLLPPSEVDNDVLAFMQAAGVEEERANQVIDALATDDKGELQPPPTVSYQQIEGVPEAQLMGLTQRLEESAQERLALLGELLARNAKPLQAAFQRQLLAIVDEHLRDPQRGPRYLTWFLDALVKRLNAQRDDQMVPEQARHNSDVTRFEQSWQAARAQVAAALRMPRWLPWRGRRLRVARAAYAGALNNYLRARYEADRRAWAVKCFDAFLRQARAQAEAANTLVRHWEDQATAAQERATEATTQKEVVKQQYSLIHSIAGQSEMQRVYREQRPVWETEAERRKLAGDFWRFVAERAPAWYLGRTYEPYETAVSLPALTYHFLFGHYVQQLSGKHLIDRLREIYGDGYLREIELRHQQTVPFWNFNLSRYADQLRSNLQNEPQLVGFGGALAGWPSLVNKATGVHTDGVNTKDPHQMVFLKTSHGLPLYALRTLPQMRRAYEILLKRWREAEPGSNPVPLHASSQWETEVGSIEPASAGQPITGGQPPATGQVSGHTNGTTANGTTANGTTANGTTANGTPANGTAHDTDPAHTPTAAR